MADIWCAETFEVALPSGPTPKAGYVYRSLGLWQEIRPSPKGRRPAQWSLTHLGTGHKVCSIRGDVATAFPVATEIAEAGNWDFLSLEGWKDRFPDVYEVVGEILSRHAKIAARNGGPRNPHSHAVAQQIAGNRP
ncbi:hypothetical protein [Novosphingobium rosa]|uniref:hypothetical protein n=1 Tax=Novosphingobium rosa TaxID=76978 RepID=UPI000835CF9B|nr:hypothetical protein [Novosphingobium rosa]